MKNLFFVSLFLILQACVSLPQTAGELKSMSSSSKLVESKSFIAPRSIEDVNASLEEAAERCMTRTQQVTSGNAVFGAAAMQSTTTRYVTKFGLIGTGGQFVTRMIPIHGGGLNEPKEGYIIYVVETKPAQTNTEVVIYGGTISFGPLDDAVKTWANTGEIVCPKLPR